MGLLTQIKYPSDLRKLSVDQLPEVCQELREDIVKELSVNPGHLASSLGVAEITVALHYVFDTPEVSVPSGSYTWAVAIVDTTDGNNPAIELAVNAETTTEGWVKLAKVNILQ